MSLASRNARAEGGRRFADQYVDGATCNAAQTGSTPNSARLSSTNRTIIAVGGRAPYPKKVAARCRISFARRSSRFSWRSRRSSSLAAEVTPARAPASISA